jgi:hypothetical protein
MPQPAATAEVVGDESLREYGERLRISVAARATVLDSERRRLHHDLDLLRVRAGRN